ncbi:hypothetical protein [Cellulomonas composti]|uniref:Uncharacterized protein n=1 Tax=Cellulomonas composti TaxID=266130 RepID=A0A511JBM9_9CELL|nr:hypothetical protein [Cellulomonas composti]GEL95390.1 hypothetical protein CCO02nite_20480 [Cellulomonas composti]
MSDQPYDYAREIDDARRHSTWEPADDLPSGADLADNDELDQELRLRPWVGDES